jgi:hypothetical protein
MPTMLNLHKGLVLRIWKCQCDGFDVSAASKSQVNITARTLMVKILLSQRD